MFRACCNDKLFGRQTACVQISFAEGHGWDSDLEGSVDLNFNDLNLFKGRSIHGIHRAWLDELDDAIDTYDRKLGPLVQARRGFVVLTKDISDPPEVR